MHKLLFILFLLSQIIQPKSLYKDHKPTVSLETGTSQKSNSEAFNSFQKEKKLWKHQKKAEVSAGLGLINT